MPKRTDLKTILVIGAGPIVIGQACEFDYSGTQACRALKEEGYRVILLNSNPATIMTDPDLADRTYIEPITPDALLQIIRKEKPEAILPTMGGQTSLNLAVALARDGTLAAHGVELIGAKLEAIELAEDRELFKQAMLKAGLSVPFSSTVNTYEQALVEAEKIGFPLILRPAFTLGGSGGGIAHNRADFEGMIKRALIESPTAQVLLEESLVGWKEFELEVMRDLADNVAIICSIENLDPMGVHTGDSITVAPAQTLSDRQYQDLRDQAIKVIRTVGVESGGSNIQFGVDPKSGRSVVIEMNPRVSRSSALASKATGYPIAKIAAKLAIGYTLDELPNQITKNTSAAFEPSIDYVVTKIPRFAFEKFPGCDVSLGTQMKSVGEVMAIGRTFAESFQKALRGLEKNISGFGPFALPMGMTKENILAQLAANFSAERYRQLWLALALGANLEELSKASQIDPWFLAHLMVIFEAYQKAPTELASFTAPLLQELKAQGFSDQQLSERCGVSERVFRDHRLANGIKPVFKMVDTCAAEFESQTPYFYSTYDLEDELIESSKQKVMILGGGPNRIGQGIEFDYCCVHASMALRKAGYESIMVNSNPETVSTDFDVSDRLYFEPVTAEDVLAIYSKEKPLGVILQLGGQTPLNIARELEAGGAKILGTTVDQIMLAENRREFSGIVSELGLLQPNSATVFSQEEACQQAICIGYPLLMRPSFVLGGQSMKVVSDEVELRAWFESFAESSLQWPVLLDQFLGNAIELDVDALSDGESTIVAGILEHIERTGIHSGDSSCVFPPQTIDPKHLIEIVQATKALAARLGVVGLMNIQFALKEQRLYVLEVNPRASRTVPFISKASGVAWAKAGALAMVGWKLPKLVSHGLIPNDYDVCKRKAGELVSVKEVVLPFKKFPGCQIALGPEMRSTGEVMATAHDFPTAFAKGQLAAGQKISLTKRSVFLSINDREKDEMLAVAEIFQDLQYELYCTEGTYLFLKERNFQRIRQVKKAQESAPNILNLLMDREISSIINIPRTYRALQDNMSIRRLALLLDIPLITTLAGARATAQALRSMIGGAASPDVLALQDCFLKADCLA